MNNSLIHTRKLEWVGLGHIPAIEFLVDQLVRVAKAHSPHWRLVIVIDISVDVEIVIRLRSGIAVCFPYLAEDFDSRLSLCLLLALERIA